LHLNTNNKNKTMKTKTIITMMAAIGALALAANAQDNTPPSDSQPPSQHAGAPGGRGGFHLLPPRAAETLKLTDDQKTQLAALEAETKAKLEKILTADQLTQLKNMRPPMRQGGLGGQRGQGQGRGPGGDENGMPPGPPPGEDGGNTPPSGPPQDGN
jgi:hypothetical protein